MEANGGKRYITQRCTTLECNGHVVMGRVSMKNDKNKENIHIEELHGLSSSFQESMHV